MLERPWVDQAVDPRRYRLPTALTTLVKAMSRLFPKADIAVILGGDANEVDTRKPEIGREEVSG